MRGARRGASAVEFALILPVFVALIAAVMDLAWLAFQRSALSSSAALGCRVGALYDPGLGDADWDGLEAAADAGIREALAATGAACESETCTIEVRSFGEAPGRSLGCTVRRDVSPLTSLVLGPMEIEATIVVRMEWQR